MDGKVKELFTDIQLVRKIQNKLPQFFQLAELESSRAGKVGMEVGSLREKILIALVIYKFGEKNVETQIPITEPEIDVRLFGNPISIKTITWKTFGGVKLSWTVDAKSALDFSEKYAPACDMLFIQINWGEKGGFFYIPKNVQIEIFRQMGRQSYIKLPKPGTNPRGVEMSAEAFVKLLEHKNSLKIEIDWKKKDIAFNAYTRWVELWEQD
ncbi:MAG TPA: type II restriction endonuclease subunit R [Elusimicrobia bacterium]|nr:type II restriction endonuclease subunit R [Elusimicrobiota bacterium]